MFWADEVVHRIPVDRPHVVNDSKTPSGAVPFSALRGPILHDAVVRALRDAGVEVRYTYGIDDMDPMDSQSMRSDEHLAQHMGKPLCAIPAPGPSGADFATFNASPFLATFPELGIFPDEIYRMRDLYRAGRMDEAIDRVLQQAPAARDVLKRVANVDHGPDYYPLHIICERCGRVGTTRVASYDRREVTYECAKDLVAWAEGCGLRGKTSPFGGRAKLPFNFEWCAKWEALGVTIEGCGKDLATAGGSRDRADALYGALWNREPPLNIRYEFVSVEGRKMSTSNPRLWHDLLGPAHDLVPQLTGEVVRFLMVRTAPNTHIDFSPSGDRIPQLFDQYDRAAAAFAADPSSELARAYVYSQRNSRRVDAGRRVRFSVLGSWLQLPKVDSVAAAARRFGRPLTAWERLELERRMGVARIWLERWAPDDAKFEVCQELPETVVELSSAQREVLRRIASVLCGDHAEPEELQDGLFLLAGELDLAPSQVFQAVYIAFIGKRRGPRAGSLLAALDPEWARRRLQEAAGFAPGGVDSGR